jgi:RNA polymerase-interacting CarD/CdnL/TRCF family regulator
MGKKDYDYEKGDWLVHQNYGMGQIMGLEKKRINGRKQLYYKVKSKTSLFWLPVEDADNQRVRPLSSKNEVESAIKILNKSPKKISKDHKIRKMKIREVREDGSLTSIAGLVRDLSARQAHHKLNLTEQTALKRFTERLLAEWSTRMGLKPRQARQKLYTLLSDNLASEHSEPDTHTSRKPNKKVLAWLRDLSN